MSHAFGSVAVLPSGEPLGRFEYNGTADVARRAIASQEAIWEGWRADANARECSCSPAVEAPVLLTVNYGRGLAWESRACLSCMTIVGKLSPYSSLYGEDRDEEPIDCSPRPRALLGAG